MRVKFKKTSYVTKNCKGIDVFNILSSYLETRGLSWKDCVGICTDGAPSMVGSIKGFASLLKQENPDIISTHCFLHREVLISKTLGDELKKVFELYIRIENYFPSLSIQVYDWVWDPYSKSAGHPENLTLKEEEELCELQ